MPRNLTAGCHLRHFRDIVIRDKHKPGLALIAIPALTTLVTMLLFLRNETWRSCGKFDWKTVYVCVCVCGGGGGVGSQMTNYSRVF